MSGFVLKCIAIIAMLVIVLRGIGRIAFPMFAFLLVEGFYHTRDVKKYITRLLIFALISELPFDLCFYHTFYAFGHQNIFFTLSLGLLTIHLITLVNARYQAQDLTGSLMVAGITIASFLIATFGHFDYVSAGILTVLLFYYFRGRNIFLTIGLILLYGIMFGMSLQILGAAAMCFLWFYNGEKGRSMKYFFYAFYPVHLLVLFLIQAYW